MNSVSVAPRLHGNTNLAGNYYRYPDDSGELVWVRMTTREREFADLCLEILAEGRVPGPTELNRRMGFGGKSNMLGGNYSKIRRAVFRGAGLEMEAGRYRFPREAS